VSGGYQDTPYKDAAIAGWAVKPTNTMTGAIMGNGNTTGTMPSPSCVDLTVPAAVSSPGALNTTGTGAASSGVLAPNAQGGAAGTAPRITIPAVGTLISATGTTGVQNCNDNAGNGTSFNRTVSNSLMYRSPVMAGFRFGAMTAMNEWKEPSSATPAGQNQLNPTFGSYSLTWAGGPFSVAGGYEVHNGFRAVNSGTPAAPTNRNAKDTGMTIGARWNYGMGLVGLGWERLKYNNSATGGAGDNGFTLNNWALEATFNITPADILWGGYSKTPGKTSCGASLQTVATATVGSNCGGDTGAKWLTLGVDHSFSKRTAVYAYWSKIDNNSAATYNYLSDSRTTNAAAGAGAGL
jgi:predicted porin